ncbi:isoaspartyl dipeptidase [Neiella marina]|uniref:Isoaspartyl dipeptidase n=1 Tax=Neiella marina TaxID=508461 RepID=A0A8J2XN13_9GAMM|nr:beta-aspartyl-peptidase [Neiella marina]GGA68263.1 isoaspartyl dipeptidase [Neiella marina]
MLTLLKNAKVYAPEPLGKHDLLIAGGKLLAMESELTLSGSIPHRTVDLNGLIVAPGLVDSLVHITGGGGEGGFATRTPEMTLTQATRGGVTTVVGALGTDATTRSLADLVAKARALEEEGISAYCHTGSYQYPVRTITGSVTDDIVLIDKFIGVGEVAISDHRGSHPSVAELIRLASEARVGGMLAGKGGVVSIHVGDGGDQLDPLLEAVATSEIPIRQFYPTHINRNPGLLNSGFRFAEAGGVIDFTTSHNQQIIDDGEVLAAEALALAINRGISVNNLTMSSDGNASLPIFSRDGELIGLEVGRVDSLFSALRQAIKDFDVPIEQALTAVTATPAKVLGLAQKGRVQVGKDADFICVDPASFAIEQVWAKGKQLVVNGEPACKGMFE